MSETKPIASLGSLLLARKGGAKPAMRARKDSAANDSVTDLDELRVQEIAAAQEDLGWNDLGEDDNSSKDPAVKRQQSNLVHRIADSNVAPIGSRASAKSRTPAKSQGRRAAFTLRLDDERHLKLKLASTVHSQSAQALLTKALDQFLAQMPEIETLAQQVKNNSSKA